MSHESHYILTIDQGTSSSRALVFDQHQRIVAQSQQEFEQHYPENGWVEHQPADIWSSVLKVTKDCLEQLGADKKILSIGMTNQRETTLIWDKSTGECIYPAIVWQDRRTADLCEQLNAQGHSSEVHQKTGLLIDSYFSATKIAWILDHVTGARERANKGQLLFGTPDCYLIWKLTSGKVHATDASNASRTMLFNLHDQQWDEDLLKLFNIPAAILPKVLDSADDYGHTDPAILGHRIPINGVAGDQQAAAIGQCCFKPGMVKSTYGTGCFILMNIGHDIQYSKNKLLTTLAYRINGKASYAIEGAIFNAGTTIQWLRDGLQVIESASESEAIASSIDDNEGVYLVPAFTGMGAPYWDSYARGAIYGITRDTRTAHFVRAALESVCYQTYDLINAIGLDVGTPAKLLKIDGGMIKNNWLCQFLANICQTTIQRPIINETTALGVAYLAALHHGVYKDLDDIATHWQLEHEFKPMVEANTREKLIKEWHVAVNKTITH